MARPPATPEQRQAQRDRIYDAAAELFATNGPGSVTVRAVAERAGTSQGTIYSYYENFGELLRALWLKPVEDVSRNLEQLAQDIRDPVERIRALLEAFAQFVFDRPDVHRGAMLFVRPLAHPTEDQFPPEQLAFYRLLVQALEEAYASNAIDAANPHETAELLWAGLHGALALPLNADIYALSSQEDLARRMIDLLIAAL